ncbi:MAG TPA: CoA-binding protein [Thermomicrobiales bacterium]|nr:CoA-binding protein [Thermomicrobiales bacterium]
MTQQRSMREMIDDAVNRKVWAIVGASENTEKFGNRIYRNLKQAGYTVYGVNPNAESVDGDPVYPTLSDLPEKPDVVDVVVPSWVGRRVASEAAELGIPFFWLQPGAESDELIEHANGLGLNVIHHACAMVEKKVWPGGAHVPAH